MADQQFPEAVEASPEESIAIARDYIKRALADIECDAPSHNLAHAATWLESALIWLPK